ncbi:MAG: FAD-dependent oxidoreductase [Kiritimatiellaeota bacterium]|nr:FAD-dependent oxidoreductase [Kiritimatiellota bacterium]
MNSSSIQRRCFIAITVAVCSLARLDAAEEQSLIVAPARTIPVIDRVDVVVVGSSEGGMAAAWKAAKLGAKVILLNEETFLGSEVTGKGRFLLDGPAPSKLFSRALFADMTPARYRVVADAILQNAGVVFVNNTRPAGVLVDGMGKLCGVVTANKAGLQAVIAKVVIDATYVGAVADEAGATRAPWNVTTLNVSRAHFSKTAKGLNEVVKEAPMPQLTWPLLNQAEQLLRGNTQSQVGNAFAYSMDFLMPNPIIGKVNDNKPTFPGVDQLNLGVCEPQTAERLLVIGSSCAISREAAKALMQPVTLAEVGERLGERAVQMAATLALPSAATVKPPTLSGAAVTGLSVSELNERERPYRRQPLETIAQSKLNISVWADYDVIVVGSGPAGHSAAIAAGRAGAKTLMIEQAGFIGGNIALGVPGFWRGYRKGFNQEWKSTTYPKLLQDAGVDIWYHSLAMGAVMRGKQVAGVEIATWLGRGAVLGKIVIDASGEGDVCAAAGAESFYLNEGDLCLEEASFKDIALYSNVPPLDPIDIAGSTLHHVLAGRAGTLKWDFMPMSQIRETRRIKGDYVINELDVDAGRTYHDVIAVSASAFDPHGYYSSDYSFAGLMPSTKHVKQSVTAYIPLRAILPAGLENIMVVGRCHSMTHDVQAMIRMNPDVINEGYAAGYAAALCVKEGTTPRQVNLKKLQAHLASKDILPAAELARITVDLPGPTEQELSAAATDPAQKANLLLLARGGERAVAPLKKSLAAAPTVPKAKALCLLGDSAGVLLLAAWLEKEPLGIGPQYDWQGFLDVPDVDGAMWVLGIPKDARAVPALVAKLRECRAETGFNKLRAVTMALGRIGSPQAAQPLAAFLRQPGIQGHMNPGTDPATIHADHFSHALLELFAASALYRCGDADGLGKKILTAYLDDWRGIFVRYAGNVLAEKKSPTSPSAQK